MSGIYRPEKSALNIWQNSKECFLKNQFKNNDVTFIETDGLKIVWEDKWVHIRKSNTEPIIRIISEAIDNTTAEGLIDSIKQIVN